MGKIEKIRRKIKELRGELFEGHNYYLDNSEQALGYSAALDDIWQFLDTLSEDGFANEGISWGGDGTRGHSSTKSIHVTYKDIQDLESIDPKYLVHEKMEEPDKSLDEAAYKYSFDSRPSIYGQVDVIDAFKAGAEWEKEQMLKIITKDDNLEEAGTQYVETYFRDIDWTPNVIKSCLEEAFISGGEYVFKQIKYE